MKFFETKYRILPVYAENKQNGFIVYHRPWFFPFAWFNVLIDTFVKSQEAPNGEVMTNGGYAYFSTENEAKDYIRYRQNIITNETLQVRKDTEG